LLAVLVVADFTPVVVVLAVIGHLSLAHLAVAVHLPKAHF
jgi:hypothetical protein